ncbi:ureidoglycolate lyase [Variovorax sp. LG9.2]|jgi:ureidoglycolate lyase|uniref:ureidoglycolate lyase n=1 Tax=Variovorax sp. LG9.2 TaxID=3048626 RepID=UPI002B236483|nr:ureidoglycolate lyase [Variovorax sp. LG9.2]MEB0055479.1 ureidoglycolate lyase [Variovorax sp. LG9.2]
MKLIAQPLTADGFAPYGTMIAVHDDFEGGRLINGGTTRRFDLIDDLHLGADGGRPVLALFRAQARSFPHAVTEMERHALGSQTFVPMGGQRRFVIVVARAGAAPSANALTAFVTDGRQGVMLAPGTWHHALLAVDAGDFVVVERVAATVDCDVSEVNPTVSVTWAG